VVFFILNSPKYLSSAAGLSLIIGYLQLHHRKSMSSALNTIASRLVSAASFGYGLFTMFLYGLLAMRKGYFFKGPSEKENLELHLGMTFLPAFTCI